MIIRRQYQLMASVQLHLELEESNKNWNVFNLVALLTPAVACKPSNH